MKRNNQFKHETLQDTKSASQLLKALTNAIAKGKVILEDENGTMTMEPDGLLRIKLSASQDDDQSKINLRISWRNESDVSADKNLKITSK